MSEVRSGIRDAALGAGLLVAYVAVGKLGLLLAYLHPSATAVWAPTGVTLAAFLLLGFRFWPVTLLGAFLVNVSTAGSPLTSVAIAVGNTAEGLVGAYLAERFAGGRRAFEHPRSVFLFFGVAAVGSTMISATVGVTTLTVAGYAPLGEYGWIWLTWWLGDAVGALVVAPVLILWANQWRVTWTGLQAAEAAVVALAVSAVALVVFGGVLLPPDRQYPLEFFAIPLFMWAAFRLGPRETATAVLPFSAIAIWGTLRGNGPFHGPQPNESLVLLQAFTGVTAATTLALAASVALRKRGEAQLRELAVRDPLTGLSNYRHFMSALEGEIARADRTNRPFAIVLLDLDDLKRINDTHGHVVGSRVLCRLASVLQDSSRAMDTAARYGGDEFVVILPEAGEDVARQVARRVAEQIAADREPPPFSVSVGLSVYPRDGDSVEHLITVADRALYAAKARRPNPAARA